MNGLPQASWRIVLVALAALTGATLLGVLGHVSSDAVVAIYTAVVTGALGQANGYRNGYRNGRNGAQAASPRPLALVDEPGKDAGSVQ